MWKIQHQFNLTLISNSQQATGKTDRVFISPVAKHVAEDLGIDYRKIHGSGSNNRITKKDVEQYYANQQHITPEATSGKPMPTSRRITAERMHQSSMQTAPVTLFMEANVDKLVETRNGLKINSVPIPNYDDFFIKICSLALRRFPAINASVIDNKIIEYSDINIGFAVDTGATLLVPVVSNCDQKNLAEITSETTNVGRKGQNWNAQFCGNEQWQIHYKQFGNVGCARLYTDY